MDNLTHAIVGGTLGGLASFRTLGKKAFYRGIALANVPDLDVFVGPLFYGSSIYAEFFHRGMFHSIFFILFLGPILASIINRFYKGDRSTLWAWTLVAWICLGSHLFIDLLTSYGTQILWPFSTIPYSLNTFFIIDPWYTIPFAVLFIMALSARTILKTVRLSLVGLCISTAYMITSFGIKRYMHDVFAQSAKEQGIPYTQSVVTPEALQIFLWRGMFVNSGMVYQGRHSIFDSTRTIHFIPLVRHVDVVQPMMTDPIVQKLIQRSRGYYIARAGTGGLVSLYDMRFGTINGWAYTGDHFMYSYTLLNTGSGASLLPLQHNFGRTIDARAFETLWQRIKGI